MQNGREMILQSEKLPSNLNLGPAYGEINTLMSQKNYQEVINKCLKMQYCKEKFIILSNAYLAVKEWKNLIQCCDHGLQYDHRQPEFYSLKAKGMGKLGKYHQKILLLKEAIKLDSLVPSYHRNLGSAYYNIKNYDLAVDQYCKAIDLQPQNVMNYHNKGSALLKNQKYEQAKLCFSAALQRNPKLALTWSWLADCQKNLGNYQEAEKLYKKAHDLSDKQIYLDEIKKLERQKQLNSHKGSWYYGIAWLGNKIF